jgi:hypothetical protein
MTRRPSGGFSAAIATFLIAVTLSPDAGIAQDTRFEIVVPQAIRSDPIVGRVYVMIARTGQREPRLQIGRTGQPFFGRDVDQLMPGEVAVIDGTDLGWPAESLAHIPPGEYYVQGFVNIYSEFNRADGHVLWMHDDRWEGETSTAMCSASVSMPNGVIHCD